MGNSKFGYSIWENIAKFGFVGPPLIRRSLDYISGLLAPLGATLQVGNSTQTILLLLYSRQSTQSRAMAQKTGAFGY